MNDIKLHDARFAETSGVPAEAFGMRVAASPHEVERFAAIMERHAGEGAAPSGAGEPEGERFASVKERHADESAAKPSAGEREEQTMGDKDFQTSRLADLRERTASVTERAPMDARVASATTATSDRAACSAEARRFGSAMERSAGLHDLETGGLKKRGGAIATDADAAKSVQSLFHDFAMPEFKTTDAAPSQAAAAAAGTDAEALEGLVDRILVSAPDKGSPEVRLVLNNDALKDTTITLARDLTGQLSVKITSGDAASLQTLVAGRSDLSQLLQARESQPVRIDLKSDADDEDEADARRRSRGLEERRGDA